MTEVTPRWSRRVPKNTKNTQAWWQLKTGWSEQEYVHRRAAVIRKIREKWPVPDMLNGHGLKSRQEVIELLRPLVAGFDDSSWSDASTSGDNFEQRLWLYTSWAFYLNRHFKLDDNVPVPIIRALPTLPTNYEIIPPEHPLEQDTKTLPINQVEPAKQDPDYWSETTSDGTPHRSKSNTVPPVAGLKDPVEICFDWDDVEVQIDAHSMQLGTVWLPMIDLKPVLRGQACHWEDFELNELYSQFSQETGVRIDPNNHEFVYPGQTGMFTFYRPGAYKVMLKRFSQAIVGRDNILRLLIQPRRPHEVTPAPRRQTPHTYEKKAGVQQITPQSRAKSRFTGSETDYSSDESQGRAWPTKRLKHWSTESEAVDSTADESNGALEGWKTVNTGTTQSGPRMAPPSNKPNVLAFGRVVDLSLNTTQETNDVESEGNIV